MATRLPARGGGRGGGLLQNHQQVQKAGQDQLGGRGRSQWQVIRQRQSLCVCTSVCLSVCQCVSVCVSVLPGWWRPQSCTGVWITPHKEPRLCWTDAALQAAKDTHTQTQTQTYTIIIIQWHYAECVCVRVFTVLSTIWCRQRTPSMQFSSLWWSLKRREGGRRRDRWGESPGRVTCTETPTHRWRQSTWWVNQLQPVSQRNYFLSTVSIRQPKDTQRDGSAVCLPPGFILLRDAAGGWRQ